MLKSHLSTYCNIIKIIILLFKCLWNLLKFLMRKSGNWNNEKPLTRTILCTWVIIIKVTSLQFTALSTRRWRYKKLLCICIFVLSAYNLRTDFQVFAIQNLNSICFECNSSFCMQFILVLLRLHYFHVCITLKRVFPTLFNLFCYANAFIHISVSFSGSKLLSP